MCNNFEPEAYGYGSKFYHIFVLKFERNTSKAFYNLKFKK